jgi:outer membrane protein assembly factor BamB
MSASLSPVASPSSSIHRLRPWPGVIIVAALWGFFEVLPRLELDGRQFLFFFQWGAMAIIGAYVVWWLFFSRAPWLDRLGLLLLCVAAGAAIWPFTHPSVDRYGPLLYVVYAIPVVLAAWVVWLIATPLVPRPLRRIGLWVAVAVVWIYPTMLRLDGTNSEIKPNVNFRWKPTPEDEFLAERATLGSNGIQTAPEVKLAAAQPDDRPGFRGLYRDGRRDGVRINTDWQRQPPREVWRHRVGPGWGSFAVISDKLFLQEQRGEQEAVVCYEAETGKEIWVHENKERFYEPVGGPGPRGTPTFLEGKLYTLGATGRLNRLDASNGKALWTRDIVADSGAKMQQWGFTASPVVAQELVTIFAGGPGGKSVLGYKAASGELAWAAGEGQSSYSSTHLARLQGVEQILMGTDAGLTSFEPATGRILWKFDASRGHGEQPAASRAPMPSRPC